MVKQNMCFISVNSQYVNYANKQLRIGLYTKMLPSILNFLATIACFWDGILAVICKHATLIF